MGSTQSTWGDHRQLKQERPAVYQSIHAPGVPRPGGGEYRWMQFAYTLTNGPDPQGYSYADLVDSDSIEKAGASVSKERDERSVDGHQDDAKRRRWQSRKKSPK